MRQDRLIYSQTVQFRKTIIIVMIGGEWFNLVRNVGIHIQVYSRTLQIRRTVTIVTIGGGCFNLVRNVGILIPENTAS
jgi:hypothetical protein